MKLEFKKPLYRKVNTRARGVHHGFGGDYSNDRNSNLGLRKGMAKGVNRGLDYTPLFKFLLSSVGKKWDQVHSEAVSRLDKPDPIYWMVSKNKDAANEVILIGESSYFSGLYIDGAGILQVVSPHINHTTMKPVCKCCTHTFNGVAFTKKFNS